MEGRELGYKTLGCGIGALIVLFCFYAMMATTQQVAKQIKARRGAKNGRTASQNLQAVSFSVDAYENATGHLPPTDSAKAFRDALAPKFLTDKTLLIDSATGEPFAPNPAVSGKPSKSVGKSYLLTTGADVAGYRTVLFVSGQVRIVGSGEWRTLTALRTIPAAPAVPQVPAPSPVQSPP